MPDGCQNQPCPEWNGAMQGNCALSLTESSQCPDRHVDEGKTVVETVTMKKYQLMRDEKVVATWCEDSDGKTYRPA